MDHEKTGRLIQKLRREKGLTQLQLAQTLHVSDKAVSKWERGLGSPDVSLLAGLSEALGAGIESLLCGELAPNEDTGGNMKKLRFYVCPACGAVLTSTGQATVSCCGKRLKPLAMAQAGPAANRRGGRRGIFHHLRARNDERTFHLFPGSVNRRQLADEKALPGMGHAGARALHQGRASGVVLHTAWAVLPAAAPWHTATGQIKATPLRPKLAEGVLLSILLSGRRAQKPEGGQIAHNAKHHQRRNGHIHGGVLPPGQPYAAAGQIAARRSPAQPDEKGRQHHNGSIAAQGCLPIALQKGANATRDAAARAIKPRQHMERAWHAQPGGPNPCRITQPCRQRQAHCGRQPLFPGRGHTHAAAPPVMPFTSFCTRAHTTMSSPNRLKIRYRIPVLLLGMPHCCFMRSSLSPAL